MAQKQKRPGWSQGALFYVINYTIGVPPCQGGKEIFGGNQVGIENEGLLGVEGRALVEAALRRHLQHNQIPHR